MYINLKNVAIVGLGLAVAGVAHGQPTSDYLKAAGSGDLYETKASKLVLATTKNPRLKAFAEEMVVDHTKSTAMVKAAAKESGLNPKPPVLSPKQQAMLTELTNAKGAGRDTLYISQQMAAHEEALSAHSDYAATGDKPALKKVAGEIVPVVKKHIGMLAHM